MFGIEKVLQMQVSLYFFYRSESVYKCHEIESYYPSSHYIDSCSYTYKMKFIAALSALVAGAITMVSAQQPAANQQDAGVYFTNPVLGSVFQAKAPYSLTW